MTFDAKLGVIGAPPHWIGPDRTPWAYEPYVRELRIWADLFRRVEVCGWAGEGPLTGNLAAYRRENVTWRRVDFSPASGLRGKAKRLFQWPRLVLEIRATLAASDLVLLRSPSHFGLFGAVLSRLFRVPSITKWAGDYAPHAGEGVATSLDRMVQQIPGRRRCVLIYGPTTRPHQVSFIPALMSLAELVQARQAAAARTWVPPWRMVSVARLEGGKGVDLALRGLGELQRRHPELPWVYTVIGDGSEREALQALAGSEGLRERVTFTGALTFDQVQHYYARAHLLIMGSINEGWPKVIAEAWAHGAIPISAPARLAPWILREPGSGVVFHPTPEGLAKALAPLLQQPEEMRALSPGLFRHAEGLSLEQFQSRLERVLVERFAPRLTRVTVNGEVAHEA